MLSVITLKVTTDKVIVKHMLIISQWFQIHFSKIMYNVFNLLNKHVSVVQLQACIH